MALIAFILLSALQAFFFWRIFEKAGYQGAWGLTSLIPFAAPFVLGFLAYADWPSLGGPSRGGPRSGTFD